MGVKKLIFFSSSLFAISNSRQGTHNTHIKMPTMKQVDEMIEALADEFDFSVREARIFLKLPVEVTKNTTPKSGSKSTSPKSGSKSTSNSNSSAKSSSAPPTPRNSPTGTRGPTAYNMFVKAEAAATKAKLERASSDGKLERGAVMKELGLKWKGMSDKQKAKFTPV